MSVKGSTRIKIWVVFVAVFALGCVTGAALDGLYRSRAGGPGRGERGRDPEEHFARMRKDLNLTDEQAAKVRAVLEETRNDYKQLRAEMRPRFEEPRLKARARIRELLDEEQRRKFDAVVAQKDAERKSERGEGRR